MSRSLRSLLLFAALPLAACSEPEKTGGKATRPTARATVYQLYVVEGAMDMIHEGGHWIREIHLPEAGISFNVEEDRLNFFSPEANRYAAPKKATEPNALQDFAAEHPPRILGEIEVEAAFVESLQRLLKERDEAREAAKEYLSSAPPLGK